jgi:succinyl-diaminopimelate desuccinylase
MPVDPIVIARDLLRCPSVTPSEGGALKVLEATLKAAGFAVHRVTLREPGTDDVENLYARIGAGSPYLVLAGHTDVVPPGDEKAWTHPPFAGETAGAELYGRGAVDMKGGIACMVAAALDYLAANKGEPKGSISFLISGDEEGIAVNGTPKLLKWAAERGEKFDHCLLGEPSNVEALGDTIKIGRRGSLNGHLIVAGKQGHVAYPDRADNPIRGLVTLIDAIQTEKLDEGTAEFTPSNLEFVSVDVGNKTVNLIPGEARARFNIRFNDAHSLDSLKTLIENSAAKAAAGKIKFEFKWEPSNAAVFVTKPGRFTDMVRDSIIKTTGRTPTLSTSGGTSDARFITNYCPVVEFGLVGQTMHQVDERVPLADLTALTAIYRDIIERYFA